MPEPGPHEEQHREQDERHRRTDVAGQNAVNGRWWPTTAAAHRAGCRRRARAGCSTVRRTRLRAEAATISRMKTFESTTLNRGASSTPAMPASTLDSSQENLDTRSALMPFSSTSRWLSTTARMRRPMGVHRNSTVSTMTVPSVATQTWRHRPRSSRNCRCGNRHRRPGSAGRCGCRAPEDGLDRLGNGDHQPDRRHELRQGPRVRSRRKMNWSSTRPSAIETTTTANSADGHERPVVVADQDVEHELPT